jgi:hypothetical protein
VLGELLEYGEYEAVDIRWERGTRGFMSLIQGASNGGAALCRGPPAVGMLHAAPPSEQRVICSSIVA